MTQQLWHFQIDSCCITFTVALLLKQLLQHLGSSRIPSVGQADSAKVFLNRLLHMTSISNDAVGAVVVLQALNETAREDAEWILWMDLDTVAVESDIAFPLEDYEGKDVVLWIQPELVLQGDAFRTSFSSLSTWRLDAIAFLPQSLLCAPPPPFPLPGVPGLPVTCAHMHPLMTPPPVHYLLLTHIPQVPADTPPPRPFPYPNLSQPSASLSHGSCMYCIWMLQPQCIRQTPNASSSSWKLGCRE